MSVLDGDSPPNRLPSEDRQLESLPRRVACGFRGMWLARSCPMPVHELCLGFLDHGLSDTRLGVHQNR